MTLWLVRHAKACDQSDWHADDFCRPLTPRGIREFTRMLEQLQSRVSFPTLIVCSPLLRTQETAEILASYAGRKHSSIQVDSRLQPGLRPDVLLTIIREHEQHSLAIVGHEPDLSDCAAELLGGGAVRFSKGSIACFEMSSGHSDKVPAELQWLVTPKLLQP